MFSIVGLVVRIKTSKSPDVTYDQPRIILWGAAEITTGLICVCIPPLATLTHPRLNRTQRTYGNVYSSDSRPKDSSRRTRLAILEEHELFMSSDVALQNSGATPGVAFPSSLVITDISTGRATNERKDDNCVLENGRRDIALENAAEATQALGTKTGIGVTTTVEQYHR